MNSSSKPLIADCYIRLSSKPQEDGMSRETQEQECRKYCESKGIILRNIYYENGSAKEPNKRPIFDEMIANQQTENKADIIICFCVNRLTRNHVDFYPVRLLVDKYDTTLIFVKENIVIQKPFKSHLKFLINILVSQAQFEVDHMSEIRKAGLIARAKTGVRPCPVPFGYSKYKNKIVVLPKDAQFIKKAFELYATGLYSINALAEKLYELGFLYKKQPNKKIPRATLASILKNLFYTGYFTYSDCEKVIKGTHKPIIDKELYEKVQKNLRSERWDCFQKHTFLFSKILTLAKTGKYMTGEIKKERYIYYTAFDKDKNRYCVNETKVIDTVLNYLKEIRLNLIPKEIVKEVLKEEFEPLKRERSNLRRDESRKFHKELRLNNFIRKNEIDDEDFVSFQLEKIEEDYPNLSKRIKDIDVKIENSTKKINELMQKRLSEIFITLDIHKQRKILNLVKNKLELQGTGDKIKMTFKSAFRKIRMR